MFVSLGCATENLAHAALNASDMDTVSINLEATKALASPLFQAITERQCTRGDYDGNPLSMEELRQLEQAARGNGVRVLLLTERSAMAWLRLDGRQPYWRGTITSITYEL